MNTILDSIHFLLGESYDNHHFKLNSEIFAFLSSSKSHLLAVTPNLLSRHSCNTTRNEFDALHVYIWDAILKMAFCCRGGNEKEEGEEQNLIPTLKYVNKIEIQSPQVSNLGKLARIDGLMAHNNISEDEAKERYIKEDLAACVTMEDFTKRIIPQLAKITEERILTHLSFYGMSSGFTYNEEVSNAVRRRISKNGDSSSCFASPFCNLEYLELNVQWVDTKQQLASLEDGSSSSSSLPPPPSCVDLILQDLTPAPHLRRLDLGFTFGPRRGAYSPKFSRSHQIPLWNALLKSTNKNIRDFIYWSSIPLNDDFINLIADYCPKLEHFMVGATDSVKPITFINMFQQCQFITYIEICRYDEDFDEESVNDPSKRPVVALAENCQFLEHVSFGNLRDVDLFALGKYSKHLTWLNFGDDEDRPLEYSDAGVAAVMEGCKELEEIEIMYTKHVDQEKLTSAAFKAIGDFGKANGGKLKKITIDGYDERATSQEQYILEKMGGEENVEIIHNMTR